MKAKTRNNGIDCKCRLYLARKGFPVQLIHMRDRGYTYLYFITLCHICHLFDNFHIIFYF